MNTIYILKTLKSELKKAKLTYKDLARELKLSEAGIKKILSRQDISLQRAIEICKALNLSFSEIVTASENSNQGEQRFTPKQTEFFQKNRTYFYFYMKLAYEQNTPLQIQSEYKLSARSLNLYLKKLEELGLIKRHPKDRAQIVGGFPLAVGTGGTELESVKFDIMQGLLSHLQTSKDGEMFGAGLYLNSAESSELQEKLRSLMSTYTIISASNRKNSKMKAISWSALIVYTPTSMFHQIHDL